MRVVVPPQPSGPPLVAIAVAVALVLAVLVGGGVAYWKMQAVAPPSPSPTDRAPPPPDAPDQSLEEARKLSFDVRATLDAASDRLVQNARSVKPPYPWRVLTDKYKAIVRTVRGKPFERAFWLDHTRWVAVAIARLSAAVSADPDNPDGPVLMKVTANNERSRDYDLVVREVARIVSGPESIHKLMEICFLLVSGDTNQARVNFEKLPPLPKGEEFRHEEGCRYLARTLLAWTKKGERPMEFARQGLLLYPESATPKLEDWEWALILVYASIPSLFHDDYGKKEHGQDVVDRGLNLLGRGAVAKPPFFAELDPAMLGEVRRVIRDAGKRGMAILGPDVLAEPPVADLVLAAGTARWLIAASELKGKEETQLWYVIYKDWLAPGIVALRKAQDPALTRNLAALDAVCAAREKLEETGVMSACRARLAQVKGDVAAATRLLEAARAKAERAGIKQNEPEIWEQLDRLGVELRAK